MGLTFSRMYLSSCADVGSLCFVALTAASRPSMSRTPSRAYVSKADLICGSSAIDRKKGPCCERTARMRADFDCTCHGPSVVMLNRGKVERPTHAPRPARMVSFSSQTRALPRSPSPWVLYGCPPPKVPPTIGHTTPRSSRSLSSPVNCRLRQRLYTPTPGVWRHITVAQGASIFALSGAGRGPAEEQELSLRTRKGLRSRAKPVLSTALSRAPSFAKSATFISHSDVISRLPSGM
jgi:hypothetical protein